MARIVTLTTDWHKSDYYVAAVKAAILRVCDDIVFVDISHNIAQYNWQQAGFLLKNLYSDFPISTIHIIGVDSEPRYYNSVVVAKYEEQYFISNDNGVLGIIFNNQPEIVVTIDVSDHTQQCTFVEKSIFTKIANHILLGNDISTLGEQKKDVVRYTQAEPQITAKGICGSVLYIDSYGNAITNITKTYFDKYIGESKFEILVNTHYHKTDKICELYSDVKLANIVCLFNSLGVLEIALRGANASELLDLNIDSQIRINKK